MYCSHIFGCGCFPTAVTEGLFAITKSWYLPLSITCIYYNTATAACWCYDILKRCCSSCTGDAAAVAIAACCMLQLQVHLLLAAQACCLWANAAAVAVATAASDAHTGDSSARVVSALCLFAASACYFCRCCCCCLLLVPAADLLQMLLYLMLLLLLVPVPCTHMWCLSAIAADVMMVMTIEKLLGCFWVQRLPL